MLLDFYKFSCGTFLKKTVIPDHRSNQGMITNQPTPFSS